MPSRVAGLLLVLIAAAGCAPLAPAGNAAVTAGPVSNVRAESDAPRGGDTMAAPEVSLSGGTTPVAEWPVVAGALAEQPAPGEPSASPHFIAPPGGADASAAPGEAAAPTEPAPTAAGPASDVAPVPAPANGSLAAPAESAPAGASPTDLFNTPCTPSPAPPLPLPGSPGRAAFWGSFREPLPLTPRWNPPGPARVGLQAGHWLVEESPPELGRLQGGATGGGKAEWEVNLAIAREAKAMLEVAGVEVDLLPSTVPQRYRANVFVSVHADGDTSGQLRGFKIARPGFSSLPAVDDQLVDALYAAYAPATALPRDDANISLRMRYYYAFNSRRYCHAVAPGVPQAIVETGFLTNAADRQLLIGSPGDPARGIAEGVLAFLRQ